MCVLKETSWAKGYKKNSLPWMVVRTPVRVVFNGKAHASR
jgi:hypothetical protein